MWDYTEKVKDHFFNPRNVGIIEDPDGVGQVGSLACGDALKLMFKVDAAGRIVQVKFQTFGCGSAIAAASALTELIQGKTIAEAEAITNRDIADYLGGLPEQKMHCSVMGREALTAAIENYRTGGRAEHILEGKVICTCFGVTEQEIRRVIRENRLTTVEQVTNYCKAGGGCGGCHADIEQLCRQENAEPAPAAQTPPAPEPAKPRKKLTNIQKIELVRKTLDEQVRPALQADGGDLELIDVEGDRVLIALRGMCAQCNVSEFTLAEVVQAKLREFVADTLVVEEYKGS
ncbi:MAG: Fe-S cluster assembly protein NifU [Sedimentisphaerales bacterium]|nr:Fe-S cluster assembly protein NifU [Sedimentisphaerales bacterium]